MKNAIGGIDSPASRNMLEQMTQPFQIYFFLVIALAGSCLFIAGFAAGGLDLVRQGNVPGPAVLIFLGIISFALFFPWFMCLYTSRILLRAIQHLEKKVEELDADPVLARLREKD